MSKIIRKCGAIIDIIVRAIMFVMLIVIAALSIKHSLITFAVILILSIIAITGIFVFMTWLNKKDKEDTIKEYGKDAYFESVIDKSEKYCRPGYVIASFIATFMVIIMMVSIYYDPDYSANSAMLAEATAQTEQMLDRAGMDRTDFTHMADFMNDVSFIIPKYKKKSISETLTLASDAINIMDSIENTASSGNKTALKANAKNYQEELTDVKTRSEQMSDTFSKYLVYEGITIMAFIAIFASGFLDFFSCMSMQEQYYTAKKYFSEE